MNAPDTLPVALENVGEIDRRDIPGYEGLYAASEDGRIFSVRRQKWMTPSSNRGYQVVTISAHGDQKVCKVHRLVAIAWIPNPKCLPQINHLDGVKSHNNVANLEWADDSRQQIHARALGLVVVTNAMRAASARNIAGYGKTVRKLTSEQAAEIRRAIAAGTSQRDLARRHEVSFTAIAQIWKGRTYVAE